MPVEGEVDVGYRVKAGYDLQALMFSPDEIEALVVGMHMAQAGGGMPLN